MRHVPPSSSFLFRCARAFAALSLAVSPIFAAPLTAPIETPAQWIRSGQPRPLTVHKIGGDMFIAAEHLARLADAQIRWQPAATQVCLSNSNGELCFDWESKAVSRDDRRLRHAVELKFQDDRLYVPLRFAISRDFGSFSATQLTWNADRLELVQTPNVTLRIPSVERFNGVYRLAFDVNPDSPPQLIEKSDKRIWLRFARAVTSGSQILEGDNVIREIRVNQKRRSADLQLQLGDGVETSDVYFEDEKKVLVVEVTPRDQFAQAMPMSVPAATAVEVRPTPIKTVETRVRPTPKSAARAPVPIAAPVPKALPKPVSAPSTAKKMSAPPVGSGIRTFVIDAGHGGVDSGAIGVRGTMEKDINLAVAKNLARQLKKVKGVRVVMTRTNDTFIPLSQRAAIANSAGGNLFVSIHCNSALSSKHNGFETYFLSPEATDKAAAAVARLENSVVSLEVQKGDTSRLGQLLASMAVYNFINESSKFAALMCKKMRENSNVEKAAVKEADFHVLRGAQMPAVLVELEYLSHPVSEIRLRSSRYQNQLVKGLVEGILVYDRQHRQEQEAYASRLRRGNGSSH